MSWWTTLFLCCDGGEHPGGRELLDRALSLVAPRPGSRFLDLAAGGGDTVRYLRSLGFSALGIDCDEKRVSDAVMLADAAALPLPESSTDHVLIECALSQMRDPAAVLTECDRVCCPGGWLILTDLYAKTGECVGSGPLGRLDTKERLIERITAAGFVVTHFEDVSELLTAFWMQTLLSGRGDDILKRVRQEDGFRLASCGYYFCIAKKERELC